MLDKELIKQTEDEMQKAVVSVKREFAEIHTGRANPHMVEGIRVDYYGTQTLLKEIATITVPDAQMIVIRPFDPNSIAAIEKAIQASNLGLNPNSDKMMIRLIVPKLSDERRQELMKIVRDMAEEGRVSIRTIRRKEIDKVKSLEKDKQIGEDARFRLQEKIQEITDKCIEQVDKRTEEKIKEIKDS